MINVCLCIFFTGPFVEFEDLIVARINQTFIVENVRVCQTLFICLFNNDFLWGVWFVNRSEGLPKCIRTSCLLLCGVLVTWFQQIDQSRPSKYLRLSSRGSLFRRNTVRWRLPKICIYPSTGNYSSYENIVMRGYACKRYFT